MPFGGDPRVDLGAFFDAKVTPDFFRFESSIGDAAFDGKEQQHAPAWKVVTLQGQISSSASEDISHFYVNSEGRNEQKIPQVNIDLNYVKKVQEEDTVANPNNILPKAAKTKAAGGTNPRKNSIQTSFMLAALISSGKTGPNFGLIMHLIVV